MKFLQAQLMQLSDLFRFFKLSDRCFRWPDLFFRRNTSGCPGSSFNSWNVIISPGTLSFFSSLILISGAGMYFSGLSRCFTLRNFLLRFTSNIGLEAFSQFDESDFGS